ncbi:hypothetical protein ACFL4T_02045 [candidate division KSB1 bacterium]
MQYKDIFENIAKSIRSKSPAYEVIEEIFLKANDPEIVKKYYKEAGWEENPYEGMEVLIGFVYNGGEEETQKISEAGYITFEDINEVAKLAFDIASIKNDAEAATYLVHEYHFGWKHVSPSLISMLFLFLERNEKDKALEFFKKNADKIDTETLNRKALVFFNETISRIRQSNRDQYGQAVFYKNLFDLPTALVYHEVHEEYEYHMTKKNYKIAAELAKEFNFPENLTINAGFMAFKVEFENFKNKISHGEYVNITDLGPLDPYRISKNFLKDYNLLDLSLSNEQHKPFIQKISKIVSGFLKELNYKDSYEKLELKQKIIFSTNIITDFKLTTDFFEPSAVLEINEIISKILNLIDLNLESIENVKLFFNPLIKLNEIYTTSKDKISQLAGRIFDIYLFEEDFNKAVEAFSIFHLKIDNLMPGIIEKCKKFLAEDKINSLKEIVNYFDIEKDLRQNDGFRELLYKTLEQDIKLDFYDKVMALFDIFNIPKNTYTPLVLLKIDVLLKHSKFEEVKKLLNLFNLEIKDIRKKLLEYYDKIVLVDVQNARILREEFGLSIFDVGIITWFIREVLNIGVKKVSNK